MLLTSWPKDQIQSYSNKYILIFESPIHSRFWERSRFPLGPFGNEPSGVASEYKTESFGENQQAELHSHRCDRPGQSENCSDLRAWTCVGGMCQDGIRFSGWSQAGRATSVWMLKLLPSQRSPAGNSLPHTSRLFWCYIASASFEAPFNGQIARIQAT